MLKRVVFLLLVILTGCSNPPPPKETTKAVTKHKTIAAKPAPGNWIINSFPAKNGESEGRKYVKFEGEGNFSDSTQGKKALFVEFFVDKKNAGIFLHKLKKNNHAEKFNEPVQVRIADSSGRELRMTSSRPWNSAGGIMIESNNNDYSQLRIFLLQSTGSVMLEVQDAQKTTYQFSMNLDGFSDNFSKL
jgi:hypothetical protein